jgi:hypothetical protein
MHVVQSQGDNNDEKCNDCLVQVVLSHNAKDASALLPGYPITGGPIPGYLSGAVAGRLKQTWDEFENSPRYRVKIG